MVLFNLGVVLSIFEKYKIKVKSLYDILNQFK